MDRSAVRITMTPSRLAPRSRPFTPRIVLPVVKSGTATASNVWHGRGSECCWPASSPARVSTGSACPSVTAARPAGNPAAPFIRALRAPAITWRRPTPSVRSCQSTGDRPSRSSPSHPGRISVRDGGRHRTGICPYPGHQPFPRLGLKFRVIRSDLLGDGCGLWVGLVTIEEVLIVSFSKINDYLIVNFDYNIIQHKPTENALIFSSRWLNEQNSWPLWL